MKFGKLVYLSIISQNNGYVFPLFVKAEHCFALPTFYIEPVYMV